MADVKWIKITTDMFDNRKIKHLRKLPDGNSVVLIWVMLLTMAGRCNSNGMVFLTENIPYTTKMLADELDFEESTVQMALQALEELDMIIKSGEFFSIAGWEEHQNTDRLSEIREYNRIAQQKHRAKQRELALVNDKSMTSQRCHETDIEEDKEEDIKKESKEKAPNKFVAPTLEEVQAYFIEKGSDKQEGEKFFYFYSSKNWMVGKTKMSNWRMAGSGWISRNATPERKSKMVTDLEERMQGVREDGTIDLRSLL